MSYDKDDISTPGPGGDYEEFLAEVTDGGDNLDNESLLKEEDSPIDELKALVLSLDWEITDQSMLAFGAEIKKLKEKWGNDKVLLNFLKILGALGEYIRAAKDLSHPDSIKILHSVFNNLEKVVTTPGIPEKEKKRIILSEFAKYNVLKDELREIKASAGNKKAGDGSTEVSSVDTAYTQEGEAAFLETEAVHDEADVDSDTYDEIELTPGVDGIIDDLSPESSNEYESTIHDTENAPLGSTFLSAADGEEVGEDGDIYAEIELTPGVDGIINDLSRETSNVPDVPDAESATNHERHGGQVIAPVLARPGGDGVGGEKEFIAERDDDVSFAAVDQGLDDFFQEDETVASAPIEEGMALDDSDADDVVLSAADQEGAENGGADAIIELQSTVDDSATDFDQPLDDFFGKDEVVASAPIEEGVALDDADVDDVMLLAVEEEVAEDDGDRAEIELQPVDDEPATDFDQRLDDFFDDDDEAPASASLGEGMSLDGAEAEVLVMMTDDDEIGEDAETDTVIELHQAAEEPSSRKDQHFEESFSYGKGVSEDEELELHTEQALPLEPLKSFILSINRQLSEQSLTDFSEELIRLKARWESEKVLLIFLHLIESLGDHLKEMGAHMQPNTTQLLLSIYRKLEKAASAQSNDIMRHGILLEAIKLYIKWNEKNIGAVLLPEQRDDESGQNMILLGPTEEINILEPID